MVLSFWPVPVALVNRLRKREVPRINTVKGFRIPPATFETDREVESDQFSHSQFNERVRCAM